MTLLPKVKLHALVSFPATVLDGTGVDVVKTNGTYQFNLDFGDFAPPAAAVTDSAQQNALLWNANTGAYTLVPMSVFASAPSSLTAIDGWHRNRRHIDAVFTRGSYPSDRYLAGAVGVADLHRRPQGADADLRRQ